MHSTRTWGQGERKHCVRGLRVEGSVCKGRVVNGWSTGMVEGSAGSSEWGGQAVNG